MKKKTKSHDILLKQNKMENKLYKDVARKTRPTKTFTRNHKKR